MPHQHEGAGRPAFRGFRPLQSNFLRGHPAIFKLPISDDLKYTLFVIQYDTHGRACRTKQPTNCYDFFPMKGTTLAQRLGMDTANRALQRLQCLKELGYIELRRDEPNAPYEVRLRWSGVSPQHPTFGGFPTKFSSVEIPNELFTLDDKEMPSELRITLVAVNAHLNSEAQEHGRGLYEFQAIFLPELLEGLEAKERTLRWRLQRLAELSYLQTSRVETSRKLLYRLAWLGNESDPSCNESNPICNERDPICNQSNPVCNESDPSGNERNPSGNERNPNLGNQRDPQLQPAVQSAEPPSIKPSLTLPLPTSHPVTNLQAASAVQALGGGMGNESKSLLEDPAVMICLEILETAGVPFSGLQLRDLEASGTRAQILQILKEGIASLQQGREVTSQALIARVKAPSFVPVASAPAQPLPAEQFTYPDRLRVAFQGQNVNLKKFFNLAPQDQDGLVSIALSSLAERPERAPWGLVGFAMPSVRRPLDAPPLRLLVSNLDKSGTFSQDLPDLVVTRTLEAFKAVSGGLQEVGSDRMAFRQAVEDACGAAAHALHFLRRRCAEAQFKAVRRECEAFMDRWLSPPGAQNTDLCRSMSKKSREEFGSAMELAFEPRGAVGAAS